MRFIRFLLCISLLYLVGCEAANLMSAPVASESPAAPVAPAAPESPAAPGPAPESPAAPADLPTVDNVVIEILAGVESAPAASIVALPPVEGIIRQQQVSLGGTVVTAAFPGGFSYRWDATYQRHVWSRTQATAAISSDFLSRGGSVIVSYSLDRGSTWVNALGGSSIVHFYPVARWGVRDGSGYVQIDLERSRVLSNSALSAFPISSYVGGNIFLHGHACTTTEDYHNDRWPTDVPHHPTLHLTEGAAKATVDATITAGVVTAVGNIVHRSGTFSDADDVTYTWGRFWDEPQRGTGAAFSFTVSSGEVSAVSVDLGGSGYRKPCNPKMCILPCTDLSDQPVFTPAAGYEDKTQAGYWLTAAMRNDLRFYGSDRLLVRFAIISR